MQIAKLCAIIANVSGKSLKHQIDMDIFLPDFLAEEKQITVAEKSLEQQNAEFADFMHRYKAAQLEAKGLSLES